jgi:hypothetical protein
MSTRKSRIVDEGPSAYQQLKELPAVDRAWLWDQREKSSSAGIIAEVRRRHGITGLSPQRLSDFWRWQQNWQEEQERLEEFNEAAESFREAFARELPSATMEQAHEATLAWLHLKGSASNDQKLMRFVLTELRKARTLSHEREKFQWDAARAALKCLPRLKALASDKSMDEPARLEAARKHLFGVTPS